MLFGMDFNSSEGLKFDFEKDNVKLDGSRDVQTNYKYNGKNNKVV